MNIFKRMFGSFKAAKFTSTFEPKVEIQSEVGIKRYMSKLSTFSRTELCTELSNVMAAKYNQMQRPVGILEREERQAVVTDLTDKALMICVVEFGVDPVYDFAGGISQLNQKIMDFDRRVSLKEVEPAQHGSMLLKMLRGVVV